jgi:hypothetical protein
VPIYELACGGGHRSETLQPSTAPLPACPACGGATRDPAPPSDRDRERPEGSAT